MVAPARAFIMREYDHHVIEAVVPPQFLMARGVGQTDRPVVIAVPGCVAPAILRIDDSNGQAGAWPRDPIGAEEHPAERPQSGWRGAIALPLYRPDAGAADKAGNEEIADPQAAAAGGAIEDFETDCIHAAGALSKLAARP